MPGYTEHIVLAYINEIQDLVRRCCKDLGAGISRQGSPGVVDLPINGVFCKIIDVYE